MNKSVSLFLTLTGLFFLTFDAFAETADIYGKANLSITNSDLQIW